MCLRRSRYTCEAFHHEGRSDPCLGLAVLVKVITKEVHIRWIMRFPKSLAVFAIPSVNEIK